MDLACSATASTLMRRPPTGMLRWKAGLEAWLEVVEADQRLRLRTLSPATPLTLLDRDGRLVEAEGSVSLSGGRSA